MPTDEGMTRLEKTYASDILTITPNTLVTGPGNPRTQRVKALSLAGQSRAIVHCRLIIDSVSAALILGFSNTIRTGVETS